MKTKDFWYDLPEELIAQTPLEKRDGSRLMVLDRTTGDVTHKHFYDLIDYLRPGDCLVMNDSRVLPARLLGHRPTGGAVEVLLLKDLGGKRWECLCRPGKKMQVGQTVSFGDGSLTATVAEVREDGNRVWSSGMREFSWKFWNGWAKCPCPPISRRNCRTRNGIRLCIPGKAVPLPPLRRACTLRRNFFSASGRRGSMRLS